MSNRQDDDPCTETHPAPRLPAPYVHGWHAAAEAPPIMRFYAMAAKMDANGGDLTDEELCALVDRVLTHLGANARAMDGDDLAVAR